MLLKTDSSLKLATLIALAAEEKKARDIIILDLKKLDAITDYFVICTGDVDQHVRAIGDHIEDQVSRQSGERLLHREGRQALNWVLLDYVDVVAHIFKPASREFYRLDELWGDAEQIAPYTLEKPAKKPRASRAKKPDSRAAKGQAKPAKQELKKAGAKPKQAGVAKGGVRKTSPAKKKAATTKPKVRRAKDT